MRKRERSTARAVLRVAAALAAATIVAAGCGDSDDSESKSSAGGGQTKSQSGNDFKVAMLLGGAVSGSAYNTDAQDTADAIEKELGIDVNVVQSVTLPNQTDVYSQFARQNYDLVMGWGGEFTDGAATAAKRFPKTQFLVINSTIENGTNLSSMDENFEQWQFIGGYLAARISKSKVVAWIGGQCFPATAAQLYGTKQGVQYAEKGAKFLSTFTGDFEDPTKAQQAAQAMIDNDADVLVSNLDRGTVGLIKAAQNAGDVGLILEWKDNQEQAPDVIASTVLKSQTRLVVPLIKRAQEGSLGGKHYQFPLPEDWGPAVAQSPLVPDDVYQEALKIQERVASGGIKVDRVEKCAK